MLLLDEPFTGLDRTVEIRARVTLRHLTEEGRLVIASHHDMDTVRDIYDEVLLLRRQADRLRPVAEVFTEARLEETFGAMPADGKEVA